MFSQKDAIPGLIPAMAWTYAAIIGAFEKANILRTSFSTIQKASRKSIRRYFITPFIISAQRKFFDSFKDGSTADLRGKSKAI